MFIELHYNDRECLFNLYKIVQIRRHSIGGCVVTTANGNSIKVDEKYEEVVEKIRGVKLAGSEPIREI